MMEKIAPLMWLGRLVRRTETHGEAPYAWSTDKVWHQPAKDQRQMEYDRSRTEQNQSP